MNNVELNERGSAGVKICWSFLFVIYGKWYRNFWNV